MKKKSKTPWLTLSALILLAFALRVYHLGESPLRGDEAFAVRYWAMPPAAVLSQLAWVEPHPFGTFFGFWLWKLLAGDSEFAMRMLPTLVNLLGVPAMFVLGRRLFDSPQIGLVAAFLWAINPDLLWHSQDVRNYAIWAGLSTVSMWLMLRAADRSRRVDWALYILVTTFGLYVFFLEALLVAVHGLYILIFRRNSLRAWLISLLIIGVLLIPWFGQLWALAHSGYKGTAVGADVGLLFTQFWPSLAFGELFTNAASSVVLIGVFGLFVASLIGIVYRERRTGILLILWLVVPTTLLLLAATRADVFRPRYLIVITPAILLPLAWLVSLTFSEAESTRPAALNVVHSLLVGAYILLTLGGLLANAHDQKTSDWRALRDYLRANTTADDAVIMTSLDPRAGTTDPAFEYYYNGPAQIIALPHPRFDTAQVVQKALLERRAVWFILVGPHTQPINDALAKYGMLITDQKAGPDFPVRQYWSREVKPGEIAVSLNLSIGGATLRGYRLVGEPRAGSTLAALLYWEGKPQTGLTAFVHLIGPPKEDGSPLWTQEDHPPNAPGRDVYHLDLAAVPSETYTIEVGLYDPKTSQRVSVIDRASGKTTGDSVNLTTLEVK